MGLEKGKGNGNCGERNNYDYHCKPERLVQKQKD